MTTTNNGDDGSPVPTLDVDMNLLSYAGDESRIGSGAASQGLMPSVDGGVGSGTGMTVGTGLMMMGEPRAGVVGTAKDIAFSSSDGTGGGSDGGSGGLMMSASTATANTGHYGLTCTIANGKDDGGDDALGASTTGNNMQRQPSFSETALGALRRSRPRPSLGIPQQHQSQSQQHPLLPSGQYGTHLNQDRPAIHRARDTNGAYADDEHHHTPAVDLAGVPTMTITAVAMPPPSDVEAALEEAEVLTRQLQRSVDDVRMISVENAILLDALVLVGAEV